MQLHHFQTHYKFYLYTEERSGISEEDAAQGLSIPFGSTIVPPPLDQCQPNEIPVFEDGKWTIVKDEFWRPTVEEINYDAHRKADTFQFIDSSRYDFINFPSIPMLLSSTMVGMRISQSLKIINKKFSQCIEMHKSILLGNSTIVLDSPNRGDLTFSPSVIHEFKTELESIIFIMRRVLDSLVQLTDILVNFTTIERTKLINYDSIGSLLSPKSDNSPVKEIILGSTTYLPDTTNFLKISNDLFNGFKHSLINDETYNSIGADCPTFVGLSVKYANHKNTIQYHNHNAYHIMMGFQDCIARILENQETYRQHNP